MTFCCNDDYRTPPLVVGLTQEQLQANFTAIQTAILQLSLGRREVSVAYSQGDGTKSVTYGAGDAAALQVFLRYYGQALGLNCGRRAIPVRFV